MYPSAKLEKELRILNSKFSSLANLAYLQPTLLSATLGLTEPTARNPDSSQRSTTNKRDGRKLQAEKKERKKKKKGN
jgi:hypothetical protein